MSSLLPFRAALGSATGASKLHVPCGGSALPGVQLWQAGLLSLESSSPFFPYICLLARESLCGCGLCAGCISGEHAQVLYGRCCARGCGLGGSRAEVFMGKGKSTSGVLCPAWLLGLIHTRLIITLNWSPPKRRSGQWQEKVQSHGEGAVQALVWEAGCPLEPLAC